jgi:Zn-dependent M28 family amino/carboxypeptidase
LDYKYNDRADSNRFYYRSDHYNFAKNGIPSVFLFSGVHDDYHKATDEVDKIEFDILAKRTQLAFTIVWELANRETRPVVDKSGN